MRLRGVTCWVVIVATAVSAWASEDCLRLLTSFQLGGHGRALAVGNGIVYVADPERGLQVVDLTDPAAPRQLSAVRTPGHPVDLAIAGRFLRLGYPGHPLGGRRPRPTVA